MQRADEPLAYRAVTSSFEVPLTDRRGLMHGSLGLHGSSGPSGTSAGRASRSKPAPQRRTSDGSIYEAARFASPPLPSQIAMSRNEARAVVAVRNRPLTVQTVRLPTLLVPANVPSGLIATVTA